VTAPFARFFQIMASLFRLTAVFTVFTDCVLKIAFGLSYVAFASVVTINSMRWDHGTCKEKSSHQGHDKSPAFNSL
jgi:hypothetical protein